MTSKGFMTVLATGLFTEIYNKPWVFEILRSVISGNRYYQGRMPLVDGGIARMLH